MKYLKLIVRAIFLLGFASFAVFFVIAVLEAREAARESSCQGHLNQLELAFRNYANTHGCFPPAYVLGPDGVPWHSWRVLILPFLEEHAVYEAYRFDEPWDGPNNRQLADKIHLECFQCCSGPDYGRSPMTNYAVVVGESTAFPFEKTVSPADLADGAENTILLVEVGDSDIHWMEPRDLRFDSLAFEPDSRKASSDSISSPHPRGPAVVFADRITAYRLQETLSLKSLKALLTIAGGEPITREALIHSGPHGVGLSD